jgi:hypothetical protein
VVEEVVVSEVVWGQSEREREKKIACDEGREKNI